MCTEQSSGSAGQQGSKSAFDVELVNAALTGTVFAGKVHHFPVIDSTQTRALADAVAGAETGQVYVADEQTAGRGRGGHTWHSAPDRGLYLTVLLRPRVRGDEVLKLSLATGLAVQAALLRVAGYGADLRWPNDIVTPPGPGRARKLGGVLIESALLPDGLLKHAAIGIGINLNQTDFPPELAGIATSVRQQTGKPVQRVELLVALLETLAGEMDRLEAKVLGSQTGPRLNERFLLASSWARGKRVEVGEDDSYTGTTGGLTDAGLLRVHCLDGSVRVVRHGGVRERLSPEF